MKFDKKRIIALCVDAAALLMLLSAGWWTLSGLEARRQEGQHMHAALQKTAMQTIVRMELSAISNEMDFAETEWYYLQQQVEGFVHKVHAEQQQAQHDAMRAQSFQTKAQKNQQKANWMQKQVNTTERARLALFQTMEEEEQAEKEMLEQLRDAEFSSGLCDTRGIARLCDLIGGITMLQKEADETDLQIHRDMERLDKLEQQEYLQIIAYQAFQQQADNYQRVADELVHAASLWAEQADQDQVEADMLVQDAESVEQQATALEQQVRSYEDSIEELDIAVNDMLQDAHRYEKTSVTDFGLSLALLVLTLVVFTLRCMVGVVRVLDQVITWSARNQHNSKDLCRDVSHVILHVLFFLATGIACRGYLANLDQYSLRKRFIVILYVAFLGSLAQSFWLQAVPHALFEQPGWTTRIVKITGTIVKMFLLRLILLLPCFFLEVLLLWLSPLRQAVLDPNDRMLYFANLSLALGLALHFLYLKPRQVSVSMHSHSDDGSTVNQDESDDEYARESTPLKAADHKSTDTELFLEMLVVRRMDRDERDSPPFASLNESSPYHVDFPSGLRQIYLLAEMFALFCVLVIINLNLELLVPEYVRAVRISLGCLLAGVTLALGFHVRQDGSLTKRAESEFSVKTIKV